MSYSVIAMAKSNHLILIAIIAAVAIISGTNAWAQPRPKAPIRWQTYSSGTSIAVSSDGTRAVTVGPTTALWDFETGQFLRELPRFPFPWDALEHPVHRLAIHENRLYILQWKSIDILDLDTGERVDSWTPTGEILHCMDLSPDGSKMVIGLGDRGVTVYDLESRTPIFQYRGHFLPVRVARFTSAANTIVSGGDDASVQLWDFASPFAWRVFGTHRAAVTDIQEDPSTAAFYSCGQDGRLLRWHRDAPNGSVVYTGLGLVKRLDLSSDGRRAVVGWDLFRGGEVRIINLKTSADEGSLPGASFAVFDRTRQGLAAAGFYIPLTLVDVARESTSKMEPYEAIGDTSILGLLSEPALAIVSRPAGLGVADVRSGQPIQDRISRDLIPSVSSLLFRERFGKVIYATTAGFWMADVLSGKVEINRSYSDRIEAYGFSRDMTTMVRVLSGQDLAVIEEIQTGRELARLSLPPEARGAQWMLNEDGTIALAFAQSTQSTTLTVLPWNEGHPPVTRNYPGMTSWRAPSVGNGFLLVGSGQARYFADSSDPTGRPLALPAGWTNLRFYRDGASLGYLQGSVLAEFDIEANAVVRQWTLPPDQLGFNEFWLIDPHLRYASRRGQVVDLEEPQSITADPVVCTGPRLGLLRGLQMRLRTLDGQVVETVSMDQTSLGHAWGFVVSQGTYEVLVRAANTLWQSAGTHILAGEGTVALRGLRLRTGDLDGDDEITLFDYLELSHAFDTAPGDPGWSDDADLDRDGAVTVFDYLLLSENFGQAGD